MLTSFDDYPIHQTAEPVAHTATGDRNFYDRYFFNGYTREGDLFFAAALGLYPNRRVMDAAFSVVRDGRQHVVRASRLAPADRRESRVGPIFVEVLEPLRGSRLLRSHGRHRGAALHVPARGPAVDGRHSPHPVRLLGGLHPHGGREDLDLPRPDARRSRPLLGRASRGRAGGRRARDAAAVLLAVGADPLR